MNKLKYFFNFFRLSKLILIGVVLVTTEHIIAQKPMPLKEGIQIEQSLIDEKLSLGVDIINDPVRNDGMKGVYATAENIQLLVSGTKRFPVVLIKYPNYGNTYSVANFQNMLFGTWSSGSAKAYYQEVSYNQFTLDGTVYGWYTADNNKAYYGYSQGWQRAAMLAKEAAQKADASTNYAQFDNDGDGYVDGFTCAHSGYGYEETADGTDIWSHAWSFSSAGIGIYTTNDPDPNRPGQYIKINNYTMNPERSNYSNYGTMVCIGVFVHEWGHALGLPDLYDTDGDGQGLGYWCLMSAGSWGGNGNSPWKPVHLSAWAKMQLGWLNPTVVSRIDLYAIPQVETNSTAYLLHGRQRTFKEYFLVENRRKTGFDELLLGQGLLIYHIDDSVISARRSTNRVNAGGPGWKYGVALEQADGFDHLYAGTNRGDAGDPFPGSSNNTNFDSTGTNPNSRTNYPLASPLITGCFVKNIPSSSSTMYCNLASGALIVTLDQRREDGRQLVGTTIGRWIGSSFQPYTITTPLPYIVSAVGSNEALRGFQDIVSNPNEKYNRWNDFTDIRNHRIFSMDGSFVELVSNFKQVQAGITIKNELIDAPALSSGSIEFKDPWLIDYPDTQYNYTLRNRGMDAPFKQRPSPFYPDYNTSYDGDVYKGVFLDQGWPGWNPPYYSAGAISPQPIEINGRTHNFYFQNWSANPSGSAEFQDANALQTPVVFKQEGATVQANMKGTQLSNDQNAFANNSQRKFVRTQNGNLHCVYESMEMVWYEKSTDGGVNWSEPKRISNYNSKERNPAMDYINDKLCIVYEVYDEEITVLMFCEFEDGGMFDYTEIKQINDINIRYSPVVAANEVNVVVVWKEALSNSLKLKRKYFTGTGWVWSEETTIPNTDINSQSPTIAISKIIMPLQGPNKSYCKLAWVNFDSEEKSSIEFYNIEIVDGSSTIEFKDHAEIALRSGFSRNHSPSIVEFNGGARVCWIGQRDEYPSFPEGDKGKTVVFTDPDNVGRYWTFGSNVNSVSINRSSSCYAIAWATDNNNERIHYTDCNTLRDFYSLNIIGKHVQLSNGTTPNTMQALAFNTSNLPYYMQTEQLYADPEPIYVEEKREGVVSEADAQVYFNIGDIEVDGEKVGFLEIPDTVNITSQQTANQYLVSLPFSLTDNSEFFYSVKYGLTDSLAALSMLSGGKSISFKVELLDAQTNEVLGVFDEVTYDQGNLIPYEKIDYQVLTNGIGERLVKMRLIINSNFTPSYSVAEKYEEPSGLAKKSYKQIGYQGSLAVKEYALEQNYPNPFNPTTTISWQSPVGSHQTLKVFDVLGREVATLVNEWREAGRYSIEFNASNLASGVYIYQLRINDYLATKKLLMIK